MSKQVNIDKVVCSDCNVLNTETQTVTAQIVDVELDPLDCTFNGDGCVEIETKDYSYITLTRANLEVLKRLINEAEKHYLDKKTK